MRYITWEGKARLFIRTCRRKGNYQNGMEMILHRHKGNYQNGMEMILHRRKGNYQNGMEMILHPQKSMVFQYLRMSTGSFHMDLMGVEY
jgi:hypothetical protein